jgi:hypothetical protein
MTRWFSWVHLRSAARAVRLFDSVSPMSGRLVRLWLGGVSALLLATSALAQSLDLATPYGNETGCRVAAGGAYTGDDRFLMRPDGYEAHESACEFVAVQVARDGAQLATALCQGEGAYWTKTLIISPPDPENNTLLVFFEDGELWHEVKPCS